MKRLVNAIRAGRFNWERYVSGGMWYGLSIQTQRLVCSYGVIGYQVFSPHGESFEGVIEYDWEFDKLTMNA